MTGIDYVAGRPGIGARLTNRLLRAMRAKTPLDVTDPAALIAARHKLDRVDAGMARLRRRSSLPFTARDTQIAGVATKELAITAPVAPCRDGAVLLFVHGGGFFFRSIHGHMLLAARIAREAGIARVVLPLYRLAPEDVYPAAQDDCLAVYDALLADGMEAGDIVVAADSAGAALALGMLLRARDRGLPLPRAVALLSPMTDLTYSGEAIDENAERDPMFGGHPMPAPGYYLGGASAADPDCSPLFADLHGLPPLLVQAGSTERLRDDGIRLVATATAAGVPIRVEIWPEMPHVFQAYDFREARQARGRIAAFLRDASFSLETGG
ncbi:alpha/beta hydrolase [Sphingomonas sp. RP10(2022)]|uniref:Alpha/beta hydrolase n=1 Tax=Sphingomonas liriopis TaxID=2949094 RepID=A0A9X2KPV4_9SPHN|nr:alpha/beta hydrolase fold domain-containing protein [Sphingomonas liriopis]MCP3734290.1 alpha/beta hydrolase [Sphingomonas liriopis]